MRQFWCIGLSALLFANSYLSSANPYNEASNSDSAPLRLACQILDKSSSVPLNLTLEAESVAEDFAETSKLVASLEHLGQEKAEVLKGFKQSYAKNVLDLERIDYQPLELLGLAEFDIAHAAFFFANDEAALENSQIEFKLVLTSIFKSVENGKLVYAGSYGSYDNQNVLCRP